MQRLCAFLAGFLTVLSLAALSADPASAQCADTGGGVVACGADDTTGFFSAADIQSLAISLGVSVDDSGTGGTGAAGGNNAGVIEIFTAPFGAPAANVTGAIVNNGTVTATGGVNAIFIEGNLGSFTNSANSSLFSIVSGEGDGLFVGGDVAGNITLEAGHQIRVNSDGMTILGNVGGDITNGGTIVGDADLDNGGSGISIFGTLSGDFTNTATGFIASGNNGVAFFDPVLGSFRNAGTILGDTNGDILGTAVFFGDPVTGDIVNQAGGAIIGGTDGMVISGPVGGAVINGGGLIGDNVGTGIGNGLRISDPVAGGVFNLSSGLISGFEGISYSATDPFSLTNAGRIVGQDAGSAIIVFSAADTTLTLLAGSNIQGTIDLGGGVNVLNVGNGLSIANSFVNTGGSIVPVIGTTNGQPFAVLGNQIAVVDPTQLSTQDESFADLTGSIFSTIRSRLSGLRGGVAGVTTNPRPMHVAGERASPVAGQRQYWAQGFGAIRDQEGEGPALDTDHKVAGLVSGVDAVYSHSTRAGFFFGGAWGEVEHVLLTQETDTDSVFGGVYVSTLRGRTAVDFVLMGGYSDYERERQVANNLAATGLQTATADYDGWFVSPEVTLTRPFWPLGRRIEKVLTLRYAGLFLDGFTEAGAAAPLTVGDREIHLGVARAALALPFERQSEDGGVSRLTLTSGIEGRTNLGDEDISATLLGQNIVFDPGGDDGAVAGFAGLTAEHTTPSGFTAFLAFEGKLEDEDTHQVSARGGVKFRF